MKDERYKVTEQDIKKIQSLRSQGMTYKLISEKIGGISWATAQYWSNSEQRSKSRRRNAQRRHSPEEQEQRIVRDLRRRKKKWEEDPTLKLKHDIECALRDKRSKRRTVRGVPLGIAKEMMDKNELHLLLKQINIYK
tara:strand:+ start:209 stop:619 length:411 start_codon:yes stop_codon:yes gene_type:complete